MARPLPLKSKARSAAISTAHSPNTSCSRRSGLVRIPDHLSFEEAATLPCAAVTAWNALDRCRHSAQFHRSRPGHRRSLHLRIAIRSTPGPQRPRHLLQRRQTPARLLPRSRQGSRLRRNLRVGSLGHSNKPMAKASISSSKSAASALCRVRSAPSKWVASSPRLESSPAPPSRFPSRLILHKQIRIQGIYVGSRKRLRRNEQSHRHRATSTPSSNRAPMDRSSAKPFKEMESATHFGKLVLSVQ